MSPKKFETNAVRTQVARSQHDEHSVPLFLTSSFVFDDAEEMRASFAEEKHMEAPNMESDIHFLKKKIEAGADYVVTQMFFDNSKFFAFEDSCRKAGIEVPIIPGLKPLATQKQLNLIPHRFHVDLPEALIIEVLKAKTKEAIRQVGIDWCIAQSKELIAAGVPFLHYYSMGKSDNIHKVASAVF